MNLIWRN